jgi:hypothetical protein
VPAASPPQRPAPRRPPGRYDEPSRLGARTVAVLLGVLFLAFAVAITWWLYQRFGTDRVAVQVRTFSVLGDDRVRVEFDVTPPDGVTTWCLVRARNAAGEEVGREFVRVPPPDDAGGRSVRVRHVLPTTDRPVTGEVQRCRPGPPPAGSPTANPTDP